MENNRRYTGSLIGGILLLVFGTLTLLGQIFKGFDFWHIFWPFIVIGFGAMFFVGMFAGGRSVSGLAVPGSIITVIGLMLFVQNLTEHWESWSYGWTVILMSVGLGIYIMGWWGDDQGQRRAGWNLIRIGLVLFILFGAFFEMLFNSFGFGRFLFPIALIGLGVYIILRRSGIFSNSKMADEQVTDSSQEKNGD